MTPPVRQKNGILNLPEVEFDRYAGSYEILHAQNIRLSGEDPNYFAEYKVRAVALQLAEQTICSIVDFGAGLGTSITFFQQYFPAARLTYVDVSSQCMKTARARHGDTVDYHVYDGARIPLDDHAVDLVFAACVFHHIPLEEHHATLVEIHRILKPDGHFFLFEHNPLNPLTMQAVNTCPFDKNAVLIRASTMRRRISEAGFRRLKRKFCIFFPSALRAFRFMERYLGWLPVGAQYFIWSRP